jgi:hypothetical protein
MSSAEPESDALPEATGTPRATGDTPCATRTSTEGSPLAVPDAVRLELTATAFHEAGHAVMALVLGRSVQKVTIAPGKLLGGDSRLGICEMKKGRSKQTKDALEDDCLILLAGMVAEARFTGQYCLEGAAQDLRAVARILRTRATSESQLARLQRRMLDKTEYLLDDDAHFRAVDSIARELVYKITIGGRAVRHLFDQACVTR